jgi:uncharacterized membrane protein
MSDLIVITYDDEPTGRSAFAALADMQKRKIISLEDAALAIKDQKGKIKVKQTLENQYTGAAAAWGGFWGLLIGLLFLSPIFWGVIGALLGAALGKSADLGIDNKFIKEVGNSLDPGGSAVFMLVVKATPDKAVEEMQKYGGHVFQTSLSTEDEEKLKAALEHDEVKDAVHETIELEEVDNP